MGYADGHPVRAIGGRLALDFANTADWSVDGAVVHEKLETPADAALWMSSIGLPPLTLPEPFAMVHPFRAAVRALFVDNALDDSMEALNHALASAGEGLLLGRGRTIRARSLSQTVALSTAALLLDRRELERLKLCPGADCGWLFLDETRNQRRRWCCMATCGNRAKAVRHYRRNRAAATSSSADDVG